MPSTFLGIEIGKRGIFAENQSILTTGHNLTNASTEGYSRQRVQLGSTIPLDAPELERAETPGQLGQGVSVERIERVRDSLVEGRIISETGQESYWENRDKYLLQLEQIHNEVSDNSVRNLMDKFWDGWQELSLRPNDQPAREAVLARGEALAEGIQDRARRLTDIGKVLSADIEGSVKQVNDLTTRIAALNEEIVRVKAIGDNPNDLMDRRDLYVEKLAKLVPITVSEKDADEFMIHTDGQILVQGKVARQFAMSRPDQDGYTVPVWADTSTPEKEDKLNVKSATLGALLELRDKDIREEMTSLDTLALSFGDMVNEYHRAGYGLNGVTGQNFFREWPYTNNLQGNYDRAGTGQADSSYIYRLSGANALQAQEQIGLEGTITLNNATGTTNIKYYSTDTVADLVNRINTSGAEVTARLTRDGKLELRATASADRKNPDYVIRHVEDSGQFLAGYAGLLAAPGQAAAFDFGAPNAVNNLQAQNASYTAAPLTHPAAWIEVAPEVKADTGRIVTGFGHNANPSAEGDGSAALAIAALRTQPVMVGQQKTFNDYFADQVAQIGLKGEEAQRARETHGAIGKDLRDLRASISGVNIDEELANMIKFQHGYNAAAKFISTMDQMLSTIIGLKA